MMATTANRRLVGMDDMRILVANEPRAYREVLAAAVQELRPQVEVSTFEPEDLDDAVVCLDPHLVVCSRLSETVQSHALTWVMLYPEGEAHAEISLAGRRTTVASMEFNALLDVIDQTARLAQAGYAPLPRA
jgi:hypothetical protein